MERVSHQFSVIKGTIGSDFFRKKIINVCNAMASFMGFASIFISFDEYTGNSLPKKFFMIFFLLIVFGTCGVIYSSIYIMCKRVNKRKLKNGNFIIEYGDLHQLMFPTNMPAEKYTVVIPVNNRLNTVAKPWGSLGLSNHGYWLNTMIKNNMDSQELQELCNRKLEEQNIYCSDINYEYPIGTCILLTDSEIGQPNVNILLAATDCINQENQSDGNEERFILGLQGIIKTQINMLYKCHMYLPIISNGFAGRKMYKKNEELINMMYQMFKFNEGGIASDIHVVVKIKENVSIF